MTLYTVQPGDTLYSIAQRVLGDGNRWKELGYTGDPRKLQVGTVLGVQGGGQPTQVYGPSSPKKTAPKAPSGGAPAAPVINADQTPEQKANKFIQDTIDSYTKPFLDAQARAKTFDEKNPFSFDEALAKSSAMDRLDPYYKAQLQDYTVGVERSKGRTIEDTKTLINNLNVSTEAQKTANDISLERTIRNSENGYAAGDTFFSGERLRNTGENTADTARVNTGLDLNATNQANTAETNQNRTLQDLTSGQNTFNRNLNAAETTAITSDVNTQKADALRKRELERNAAIGFPYLSGTQAVNNAYGLSG